MAVLDYAKAGMYASDLNFGSRRGLSDPSIANNLGNRGVGAMLKVGLVTGALFVASLAPVAWHKFNSGITVTGAGVSQWDDASGLGHHLLQASDAARPPKQADGSILFDGVAQFLKATGYTLVQPETIYLLFRQVTWTLNDCFFDGDSVGSITQIYQSGVSPSIRAQAGAALTDNAGLPVGNYGVAVALFNGAASQTQVNNGTPVIGNTGANNSNGALLGGNAVPGGFANMQAKELVIFSAAHTGITKARMVTYAAGVGNLFI